MIVINHKPRRTRFHARAVALIKSGVRVGHILAGTEPCGTCHVCKADVPYPDTIHTEKEAWVECPGCKTPFVLESVL